MRLARQMTDRFDGRQEPASRMRNVRVAERPTRAPANRRLPRRHHPAAWLFAHLRAPWIDRQLTRGVASWHSPTHAARALQLTNRRRRCVLAAGLERLAADAARPPLRSHRAPVIAPCREQVQAALPLILAIATRLRADGPVDARGVAGLRLVITDGAGPCYSRIYPGALTDALEPVSQWLDAPD
jgi:hypothetical protein